MRYFILFLFSFNLLSVISSNRDYVDSLICQYNHDIGVESDSALYFLCYDIVCNSNIPEEKISFSRKAYYHALNEGNILWQAASKYLEVGSYVRKADLDSAVSILLESKELYSQVGNAEGLATCKLMLGWVYDLDKEYKLSVNNYNCAIDDFKLLGDSVRVAAAYVNLGELYRRCSLPDLAMLNFKKSIKISESINNAHYLAYSKGNVGLVFSIQNKLDSAEIYLNKSIQILEPLGDNYAVSSYLDGLAEVYFKRKQYNKAKLTAQKSLRLAKKQGLKEQMRDAYLRLSTIYDQSKDFEKAFYHHKLYVAYRDSINNEETIRKIAHLNAKYEVAQKQKEVDAEKMLKDRYRVIAICAILVLVISMVLGFVVLRISNFRRKVNKKLEEQRKELTKANATKNKFFSILSHDLRSPLASYHTYLETVDLCVYHKDFDKLTELTNEMQSSSANLIDLLDNLLQWGVNQMGINESVPTRVNVNDIVIMEIAHLKHVSDTKQIVVDCNVHQDITLFVDRVRFAIAIRNLICNAIKYTDRGGEVSVCGERTEDRVIIKVADTGVGMSPEQKESLFDFNSISSTYGTQNEKGVGLGMQLVWGFVKESHANIHVESEIGKGSAFVLTFDATEG